MSFFSKPFKKKARVELHDPVLGPLTFSDGIWAFIPKMPDEKVMVTVVALETGPTDQQRNLFKSVRSNLSEFEDRARNFLRSRVDQCVDVARLSIYSIEIGDEAETAHQQFVLELSDDDAVVVHRVVFRGGEAIDYGLDD
jgi:hypothetical protein